MNIFKLILLLFLASFSYLQSQIIDTENLNPENKQIEKNNYLKNKETDLTNNTSDNELLNNQSELIDTSELVDSVPQEDLADITIDDQERSQATIAAEESEKNKDTDLEEDNNFNSRVDWIPRNSLTIKGLDKITARVFSARIFINQKVRFGTLELYVRTIYEKPPEETPEKICFVEIYNTPPGKKQDLAFSGWMFASSPALSALEHPVYDIWIE